VESIGNKVGRITTAGVITEFPIPTIGSAPFWIAAGPDGNLWFTEFRGNSIGRITTGGVITEFLVPTMNSSPGLITLGPDGNLWFTEEAGNNIGRITPAGVITEFAVPTGSSRPVGIVAGPDGNLWFAEGRTNKIGKAILANTPSGTSVMVQPTDSSTGGNPVTLTFGSVNQAGTTNLATSNSGPMPPAGFALGIPAVYYNLATTAVFTGGISICINYSGIAFASTPDLFHFEGGAWLDVTTSQDTIHNVVCGSVTSLSPFALFRKTDITPPIIVPTISGTAGTNGWYTSNVTVSWSATDPESGIASSMGCGTTTLTDETTGVNLTCSATNGVGLSTSSKVSVKIDKTPPDISGMPATGCTLWPPDGKFVQVADVRASDALSGIVQNSLVVNGTSNEMVDPAAPDIAIASDGSGGFTLQLRADRLGSGNGRIYTLTATAIDQAGNRTNSTAACNVPHDQGH
jgi:hypothetical protein